ncbi:acetyltransferase [Achromobacter spanius]|uniref:Acetyltransferase n=2 Tax=Achromobacter spanius TaxID=217203 RepID=A0AAW3I0D1_9BURK|nr:acetyltransferase [Achromobacter spanius]
MPYRVRPMLASDVDGILDTQALAYPDFLLESAAFFLNRLLLAPDHCWVACASDDDALLGYLISYPWDAGLPPALGVALTALPAQADHWFLHDCAVAPAAQGLGVGRALLHTAATRAVECGLQRASLVSLASAASYWHRHGYRPLPATPDQNDLALADKLAGYGPQARYLARGLPL